MVCNAALLKKIEERGMILNSERKQKKMRRLVLNG